MQLPIESRIVMQMNGTMSEMHRMKDKKSEKKSDQKWTLYIELD